MSSIDENLIQLLNYSLKTSYILIDQLKNIAIYSEKQSDEFNFLQFNSYQRYQVWISGLTNVQLCNKIIHKNFQRIFSKHLYNTLKTLNKIYIDFIFCFLIQSVLQIFTYA